MTFTPDLATAGRIVVKIGSSSLTTPSGVNTDLIASTAHAIAAARGRGSAVVLVSSGAVAAGMAPLGFTHRPADIGALQAAAMVGQSRLMSHYSEAFATHGLTIAQILLTAGDVEDRRHYANAQRALEELLRRGIVPIVNENDAVVTDELRFGDNDRLAALVAHLIGADAVVLCTDVDGLYTEPPKNPGAQLIPVVGRDDSLERFSITDRGSGVGTGGMRSKVGAAMMAGDAGIPTLITSAEALSGHLLGHEARGTWVEPRGTRQPARRLWIAHAVSAKGTITVDAGAAKALRQRGVSLLPVGVTGVSGSFGTGDLVDIVDGAGTLIARGLSAYADVDVMHLAGTHGDGHARPVVHADDMVHPSIDARG